MTAPGGPPSARARRAAVVLLPALLVATAACTPADDDAAPAPTTAAPPTDAAPPAEDVALPDGPAGEAAWWLLDRLADPVGTPLESPEDRFTATFLAEVPAAELEALLDQLRAQGPWTPTAASGDAAGVVVTVEGGGTSLDMQVAVDAAGLVQGLFFAPTPPPREPAASWEELGEEVEGWDLRSDLLVARVDADGTCTPVGGTPAGTATGEPLPMGSVAKLYVLGAVVDAVAAGELAWEDALTVTDDARSLPSGRLQDAPDGTTVTVLDAARDMIAISDNTATDLLVAAVGRDRVEAAVADMGHADPGSLAPFPTTRDLFRLGWGGGPELRAAWRDGEEAQRRALIEGLPPGPLRIDVAAVASTVFWLEGVDWFGTPLDLCAAHVALAERGATPAGEPVREILAANPGAGRRAGEAGAVPAGTWPYLAFKGGSAPGTMAGAWYAEGPDDDGDPERVVVVLQTAAPTTQGALPAATMVGVAADALRLAADEG